MRSANHLFIFGIYILAIRIVIQASSVDFRFVSIVVTPTLTQVGIPSRAKEHFSLMDFAVANSGLTPKQKAKQF